MLKRITIEGLGPHSSFSAEFNPRGTTVVAGPSECGKTTVLEALMFALWGRTSQGRFPVEFIRDGANKAVVELVLDSGKTLRRSVNRNKSQTRRISHWGNEESYSSDTKFQEALGDLGRDPVACQLVIAPMGWVPLVAANARPFRDILSRVLPKGDVPAEIRRMMDEAGFELESGEEIQPEKTVMTRRREASRTRDEMTGRVKSVKERIGRILAQEDDVAATLDTTAAQEALDRQALWDAYGAEAKGAAARQAAVQAQAGWDARLAEIGAAPAFDADDVTQAKKDEKAARSALKDAMATFTDIDSRRKLAQEQLKEMTLSGPDVCPTCERPGWEDGAAAYARQEQAVAKLDSERDAGLATGKSCRQAHNETTEALEAANQAKAAHDAWSAGKRALGDRPELPPETAGGPAAPDVPAPSAEELTSARETMDRQKALDGAAKQRQHDLDEAQADLEKAEDRYAIACGDVDRLSALLDSVRAAPSVVAERQAEALGDLGPVKLEFGENPAVSVLIDGRPWWLASRGRQVVADVWLRTALRRAMGFDWLPIVIDNVQDVGGQPVPDVDGPSIVLKTTDASSISVVRKRS
ncbi:MAG: AAA family ATPase [Proteobacteria bacterium]|nr:AAA family ATPase [Pseudomonadota bacterium]